MENILVDSDVIIDYLRGQSSAKSFFESSSEKASLYTSVVNVAEIYSGKETKKSAKEIVIANFLNNFKIAVVTPSIAKSAGILKRDFDVPFADALVAATALEYDFHLATRNLKHFRRIPKLKILKPY